MSDSEHFTDERIIQTLEAHGCSWRDYILVGSPASVCRFVAGAGLSALLIEHDALAAATIQFLSRHGARSFPSVDDAKREFGWDGVARVQSV
jgi:hypothetical protein